MKKQLLAATVLLTLAGFATCLPACGEIVLHRFNLNSGGYRPIGTLVRDKAGNLYGVTNSTAQRIFGGDVFELSPQSGGGWSYSVIYQFSGVGSDSFPSTSLAMDAAGNLYGVAGGNGEIYELSPDGVGGWKETILYVGSSNVDAPVSGLVFDASGNAYGVAGYGPGVNGFVFELFPSNAGWTFHDIYDFKGQDGSEPASLIVDGAGNLYGTTIAGGSSSNCSGGCGVVFELIPSSGNWSEKVLLNFNGTNGSLAEGPLAIDAAGNLYGAAASGGPNGFGVAFALVNSGGVWTQRILHSFTDANGDGSGPNTGVIMLGRDLYGATSQGGSSGSCSGGFGEGCGTVFKLTRSGTTWKESILHSFTGGGDGAFPWGLVWDGAYHLYGVTDGGGSFDSGGLVYELAK